MYLLEVNYSFFVKLVKKSSVQCIKLYNPLLVRFFLIYRNSFSVSSHVKPGLYT